MKPTLDEVAFEFKARVLSLLLNRGEIKDTGVSDVWELNIAGLHMMREEPYGKQHSVGLIVWPIDYSACAIYQDGPGDTEKRNYLGMKEALPALRKLMILDDLAGV
jgi:hypothetical protein